MEYKPYSYQYETSPRKLQPEYDLPRKNNKAKLNNSKQKNTGIKNKQQNNKKSKKIAYFSSCKGRNAYISSFPFLPAENQADYLLLVSAQAAFLEGAWGKPFFGQQRMVQTVKKVADKLAGCNEGRPALHF